MDVCETRIAGRMSRHIAVAVCATVLAVGCRGDDGEPAEPAPEPTPETDVSEAPGSGDAEASAPAVEPAAPVAPIEVARTSQRRPDVETSRELAAALGLAPPDPLLVSDLLTRADVRELAQFQGELLETGLAGIKPSPTYNSIRLQADGGYGFALQLWQHDEVRQVSQQFRRLRETYFDSAPEAAGVANESFSADFQGIRHYAFVHRASRSVAIVTCDDTLCDLGQARALAQRVANRL